MKNEIEEKNKYINTLIAEQERQRIGQDLHDTLGHVFVSLSLKSELAYKLIDKDQEKAKNEIIFVITSFIFFSFLYLPIFSESRMALTPGMFIIILSAYSLEKSCNLFGKHSPIIRAFTILIISSIFVLNLNLTYENPRTEIGDNIAITMYNSKRLETESVALVQNYLPEKCYIIAEFPIVLTSISNMVGLSTEVVLKDLIIIDTLINKGECVYYFYDGYCSDQPLSPSPGSKDRCQKMLEVFDLTEEKNFEIENNRFFLFRINGLSN